ncbi:MAG: hypothetical protein H6835_09675 [Planctomycetes bacterium]|nr:hypothetical protein [Planctomycetota bacterium]
MLLQNQGNGTFVDVTATAFPVTTTADNFACFDCDDDGDGDIDLPGKPNFLRQTFAQTAPMRGASYSVEFHARPGTTSLIGACGALGTGILAAGPFGVLGLDPATAASLAVALVGNGPLTLTWTIPNLPALAGLELDYQALVVDPLDGPVVSNRIRDVVQ